LNQGFRAEGSMNHLTQKDGEKLLAYDKGIVNNKFKWSFFDRRGDVDMPRRLGSQDTPALHRAGEQILISKVYVLKLINEQ